jgi:hypothetical protein
MDGYPPKDCSRNPLPVPVLYKNFIIIPDHRSHINQPQSPSNFNTTIMFFSFFTKVRVWPSSLVVTSQKRATNIKETAEATDEHASWGAQAHRPFS